jgi:hypothetical protein
MCTLCQFFEPSNTLIKLFALTIRIKNKQKKTIPIVKDLKWYNRIAKIKRVEKYRQNYLL